MSLILPNLFLGNFGNSKNRAFIQQNNITLIVRVVDLADSFRFPNVNYHIVPMEDYDEYPIFNHFDTICTVIKTAHDEGKNVLVHCAMGKSRSATIVCAYLIKYLNMSVEEALLFCQSKRRLVCPNAGFLEQLQKFRTLLNATEKKEQS